MFFTEVNIPEPPKKISLDDDLMMLGSCFADQIGKRLKEYKFKVTTNPFGIVYNPLSLFQNIKLVVQNQVPDEESYLVSQGIHYNYHFHSDLSALSQEELKEKIKATINREHLRVGSCNWLILTLGTAIIYQLKENNLVVANCHKVPGKLFSRKFLEPVEIIDSFNEMFDLVRKHNPTARFIVTVSPVRHIKEGLLDNSYSKSILRYCCEQISQQHKEVYYFPAYEICIDELRDYRFYAEDLVHPNQFAVDLIWNRFNISCMDQEALNFIEAWGKIRKSLNHRPFYPQSEGHQTFLKSLLKELESFPYPVNVGSEINKVKNQLL